MTDQPPGPWGQPQDPHEPVEPGYRPQPGYQPKPSYQSQPGYQPQPGYGPPPPDQRPTGSVDFARLLGPRVRRRPEPRFASALAAGGAGLALIGAAIWGAGYFVAGFHLGFGESGPTVHGDSRRFLGAGLFLVLVVAGYALAVTRRRGPLATAGTVAIVAGVPGALLFALLDVGGVFDGGGFPFNVDAFYLITILVYLVSYFFVPGTAGRAVLLALAASGVYSYIGLKIGSTAALRTGVAIYGGAQSPTSPGAGSTGGIAAVGLIFGIAYYAVAALLDRSGRPGAAIALVFAGFGATLSGLGFAARPFGQIGIGVALLIVGGALALYGGWAARRFTTWFWTVVAMAGVLVLVVRIGVQHHYLVIGVVLVVLGAVVVAVAPALSRALHESPDLDERPGDQPSAAPSLG